MDVPWERIRLFMDRASLFRFMEADSVPYVHASDEEWRHEHRRASKYYAFQGCLLLGGRVERRLALRCMRAWRDLKRKKQSNPIAVARFLHCKPREHRQVNAPRRKS